MYTYYLLQYTTTTTTTTTITISNIIKLITYMDLYLYIQTRRPGNAKLHYIYVLMYVVPVFNNYYSMLW